MSKQKYVKLLVCSDLKELEVVDFFKAGKHKFATHCPENRFTFSVNAVFGKIYPKLLTITVDMYCCIAEIMINQLR